VSVCYATSIVNGGLRWGGGVCVLGASREARGPGGRQGLDKFDRDYTLGLNGLAVVAGRRGASTKVGAFRFSGEYPDH